MAKYFSASLNPLVLRLGKVALSLMPKGMKSNKNLLIKKVKISTRDNKKIATYVITPKNKSGNLPVIFYFHGGAFAFKAAPYHYYYAKQYAQQTNSIVVFVDYRLSYCSNFNTSLNDCVDAYRFILENSSLFDIDKEKITVAGDSAGGYLSVMTIVEAKKQNLAMPKHQLWFILFWIVGA